MVLVAGATGHLGSEICRLLTAKGVVVRGLARSSSDPAIQERLRSMGVELVEADLKDRASLDRACRGVEAVITTVTVTRSRQDGDSIEAVDERGSLNLIDAAKANGVAHFIYTSYSGNVGLDDPLTRAKRGAEQHLKASGLAYTILRPSYFMEVWLSPAHGFDYQAGKATIYGSGEKKISWVSLGDVAKLAVECLSNPAARNAVIEFGGPEALSPREVIEVFEEIGHRPFAVQYVPEEAIRSQGEAATDSLQKSFSALMLSYANGDHIDAVSALERIPMQLASVRDYAQRVLSA